MLEKLPVPAAPPNPEAFRAALESATDKCVTAIRDSFSTLQQAVLSQFSTSAPSGVKREDLLSAVHAALEKVAPVEVKALPPLEPPPVPVAPPAAPPPTTPPTPEPTALQQEIAAFVDEWAKRTTVGCQLDVLLKDLHTRHPQLTIGAFHDALRQLHESGRIRLGGWPKMLDDLPEPELALFISSRVMYYAQPAH